MNNRIYIGEGGLNETCDGLHCICIHKDGEDQIGIWVHSNLYSNRSLVVYKNEILSKKVIEFLNADAYDFIKEVEKCEFL